MAGWELPRRRLAAPARTDTTAERYSPAASGTRDGKQMRAVRAMIARMLP